MSGAKPKGGRVFKGDMDLFMKSTAQSNRLRDKTTESERETMGMREERGEEEVRELEVGKQRELAVR